MTMASRTARSHPRSAPQAAEPTPLLQEVLRSLRASPVFAFYLLLSLAVAGYIGLVTFLMNAYPDVLPGALAQMSHFGEEPHRVHDLTYGFVFTVGVVGLLAQLRRPTSNVAGMAMALVPWAALLLAAILSDSYTTIVGRNPWYPLAVVAAITGLLHPAGRDFFCSFSISRVNWVMLALVGAAAVPLLAYASTNIRLQSSGADGHAAMGHYGFMAAFSYNVIAVGVLASLRPAGWQLAAWVTGLLPALLGVTSLVYSDVSSRLDARWALAAIAWGAAFTATALLTRAQQREQDPAHASPRAAPPRSAGG